MRREERLLRLIEASRLSLASACMLSGTTLTPGALVHPEMRAGAAAVWASMVMEMAKALECALVEELEA